MNEQLFETSDLIESLVNLLASSKNDETLRRFLEKKSFEDRSSIDENVYIGIGHSSYFNFMLN